MRIEINDQTAKTAMGYLLLAGHKEFVEIALAIEDGIARAKSETGVDQSVAEDPRKAA